MIRSAEPTRFELPGGLRLPPAGKALGPRRRVPGFRGTRWAVAALLAAVAGGCSARAQVRSASPEAGVLQSHAAPFEKVRKAAQDVLAGASLTVSEERWIDRGRWSVMAAAGLSLPPRRMARIVVEDHPSDCRVWILVQSRPSETEEDVAEDFQGRIAGLLGLEARPPERLLLNDAGEMEVRYRSPLPRCAEATSKAVLDGGYDLLARDSKDEALHTISAEKKPSHRFFAALYRESDGVTRVVIEVRGGSFSENCCEMEALRRQLEEELGPES